MAASKEQLALQILRLLTEMKWPTWGPHFSGVHGGLEVIKGHPRGVSGNILVRNNEIYIGMYSPLADLIRDWQNAPSIDAPKAQAVEAVGKGKRLRRTREGLEHSLAFVAKRVGCSSTTIRNRERLSGHPGDGQGARFGWIDGGIDEYLAEFEPLYESRLSTYALYHDPLDPPTENK